MRGAVTEQLMELGSGAARVRAGFRAAHGEFLAGGPIELELIVECVGAVGVHVLGGIDRSTLRPALYGFGARLEGSAEPLGDPLEGAALLGGPSGTTLVEAGGTLRVPLLLNEFLLLEHLLPSLPPDGDGVLLLHAERPLPIATSRAEAFAVGPGAPVVASDLRLPVRRDEPALERLIDSLRRTIEADHSDGQSSERRRAIDQLATLGTASARRALDALAAHPDPWLQMRRTLAAARPL